MFWEMADIKSVHFITPQPSTPKPSQRLRPLHVIVIESGYGDGFSSLSYLCPPSNKEMRRLQKALLLFQRTSAKSNFPSRTRLIFRHGANTRNSAKFIKWKLLQIRVIYCPLYSK